MVPGDGLGFDLLDSNNTHMSQEELDILSELGGPDLTALAQPLRQSQRMRAGVPASSPGLTDGWPVRNKREAEPPPTGTGATGIGLNHPKRQRTQRGVPRREYGGVMTHFTDGQAAAVGGAGRGAGRGGRQGKAAEKGRGKERVPSPEDERSNMPNFLQVKLRSNRYGNTTRWARVLVGGGGCVYVAHCV